MLRPVLFVHRWLGVFVGLLMTVWCLSGFVMMYVDYPRLMPAEQLRGLSPLQLPSASRLDRIALADDQPILSAKVEMMAGRAVLRVVPGGERAQPIPQMRVTPAAFDLTTGQPFEAVTAQDAKVVALTFAQRSGIAAPLLAIGETGIDQWTVQTYTGNAPLRRADFADGTQIYISGKTGEVVQQTMRFERFWGWLGAVPHWLYPTLLRQNGALWSQVVIWTSLAGCFLTVTGIWAGIVRLRRKDGGRIGSPFRGVWWWHHVFGLFFGLLTLTWVASGLFSMNPWGFLDSMAGFAERERLTGQVRWAEVRGALAAQGDTHAVRLETAPLGGRAYIAAVSADGETIRFDADGGRSNLTESELRSALKNGPPLAALGLLHAEDSYYYSHKFPAPLPVWRAVLGDAESTRLYIDPASGRLVRAFDGNGRSFRWLQDGLHSLDFPILRKRPIRDLVVIPLLAMVTLVCGTGTWMAWTKAARDLRRLRRRRRRLTPLTINQGEHA